MAFASLHGHTCFSDGFNTPEEIYRVCVDSDCVGVGFTDHGTMGGTFPCVVKVPWDQGKVCFVAGLEGYHWDPNYTFEEHKESQRRSRKQNGVATRYTFHITLLAVNDTGYKNLCRINYNAWKTFYKYPLINMASLGDTSGIVCFTGCPSSYFVYLLLTEQFDKAKDWVKYLKSVFGTVFVEVMGGWEIHKRYEKEAMDVARLTNTPVVATKDYHYGSPQDKVVYDALCLAKRKPVIQGAYDLATPPDTIAEKEGLDNALSLLKGVSYSKLKLTGCHTRVGAKELWGVVREKARVLGEVYQQRVEHEISVIEHLDMGWYIAMLYEICQYMNRHGVLYEARGSASGSLVCYLLGITCIDPIRHNMLFERFMSKSRREIPDIDLDVPSSQRGLVISELQKDWVVAKITTTSFVGEKLAQHCYERVREQCPDTTVTPQHFVGRVYNTGVHASGMVLVPHDTNVVIPMRHKDGWDIVEFEAEHLPFVKWDLLGQKTLDVVQDTYRSLTPPDQHCLNGYLQWRDKVIYNEKNIIDAMLHAHECGTPGVFQLEGSMSSFFLSGSYWSLDELSKLVAIYRPAVLASPFVRRLLRGEPVDPVIAECCRSGFPIYQEDLMQVLTKVANVPLEETYTIIKKTARKDPDAVATIQNLLKANLSKLGPQRAQSIVDTVIAFTGYGFNVAHAVAYAVRMGVTAYLKHKYPHVYFTHLLNRENDIKARLSYILHLQYVYNIRPVPAFSQQYNIVNNKLLVPVDNIKRVSVKDVPHIVSGQGLSANQFVQHCLDNNVSLSTIKGLDDSGFSKAMWGVPLVPRFTAAQHNRKFVKKKVTVPPDQPFSPQEPVMSLEQYNLHISQSHVPLTPCPLPPVRLAWAPKDFLCCGLVVRSGKEYTVIDTFGEQYVLEGYTCSEHVRLVTGLRAKRYGSKIKAEPVASRGNQHQPSHQEG
mgnify:CR=1 FL=1